MHAFMITWSWQSSTHTSDL